jgi:hypothetical protein
MKRRYIGLALGVLVAVGAELILPSCARPQQLVGLTVRPSAGFTFLVPDPALTAQYTATGTYIHPPATKDITNQVTWKVDFPQLITFSASTPGLVSPEGNHCGVANISATAPAGKGGASNIVIGYSTVTVNDPAVATCPGGGTQGVLSVQILPSPSDGTVTSLNFGINCPSVSCVAVVPVGTLVTLTATASSSHSFVSWQGCTPTSGNSCTVTVPTGGVGVVANFTP